MRMICPILEESAKECMGFCVGAPKISITDFSFRVGVLCNKRIPRLLHTVKRASFGMRSLMLVIVGMVHTADDVSELVSREVTPFRLCICLSIPSIDEIADSFPLIRESYPVAGVVDMLPQLISVFRMLRPFVRRAVDTFFSLN
jgi:hypothetical protein